MKLKPYSSYKDSGVEWIGLVPEGWNKSALKFLAEYQNGYAFKPEDWSEEGLPIIRIAQLTSGAEPSRFAGEIDNRNFVENNDLLFSWSATLDTFIWQGGNAWLNQHIFKVSPTPEANKQFLYWLLKVAAVKLSDIDAHGSTMKHIKKESLGERVYIPKIDVQKSIANFLDRETAKLDNLIAKQEKLIELLQEKHQAIISHAVTKGLNPDAKLKDSGVEWLGEVPNEWTPLPIKLVISTRKGVAFKAEDFMDNGVMVVKASDIKKLTIQDSNVFLPLHFVGNYPKAVLKAGDIILSTVGSTPDVINSAVGQIARLPIHLSGSLLNQNTVVFTPDATFLTNDYLFYLLRTSRYREHLNLNAHGTANQASLNIKDMLDIYFAIPPIDEQKRITTYLDNQTSMIEILIEKANYSIELAKEHRTALISAAVTGKIDVREAA